VPVEVRCPRGSEAVRGGYQVLSNPGDVFPVGSLRVNKRTWEVQFGVEGDGQVTAYAYCDKSEPGLKVKSDLATGTEDTPETVEAKCKRKQQLRSGGFDAEYDEGQFDGAVVTDSRRDGRRRWEITAFPFAETPTVAAYAYCEKKPKKKN
jgi:hypothetical protein